MPTLYSGGLLRRYFNPADLGITRDWFNSCSDGFLDCSGQSGPGNLWFHDYQVSSARRA